MRVIKRVLLFPIIMFVAVIKVLTKIFVELESYVIGLFMILFTVCLAICIWQKMWDDLKIFGMIAVAVFLFEFMTSLIIVLIELLEGLLERAL